MHQFLKIYFWNKILHVSDSSSVHHQEFFTVHSNGICHTGLLTACEQDPASKLSANLYVLLCVQWKAPDDGHRNCPKHVEFYSKKKFWEISASSWFYYKKLFSVVVYIFSAVHKSDFRLFITEKINYVMQW